LLGEQLGDDLASTVQILTSPQGRIYRLSGGTITELLPATALVD